MTRTVIQHIASLIVARHNCIASGNTEWESNHTAALEQLAKRFLPSGSGFDSGCTIDIDPEDASYPLRAVTINASYHHMDENGFYCGWSDHVFTIRPAFDGIDIDIDSDYSGADLTYFDEETGETVDDDDQSHTEDYLCDTMRHHLERVIVQTANGFDYLRDDEGNVIW